LTTNRSLLPRLTGCSFSCLPDGRLEPDEGEEDANEETGEKDAKDDIADLWIANGCKDGEVKTEGGAVVAGMFKETAEELEAVEEDEEEDEEDDKEQPEDEKGS